MKTIEDVLQILKNMQEKITQSSIELRAKGEILEEIINYIEAPEQSTENPVASSEQEITAEKSEK